MKRGNCENVYLRNLVCGGLMFLVSHCTMKDHLTFFPDRTSSLPESSIPEFAHERWINTSDGETIQSYHFLHHETQLRPLIIYFHGNAGNLYSRFDTALRLYELDHDVLLVSYRGYANSTGKPTEQGIYWDGAAAVDFAIGELGYQEGGIIIFGRSLGSAVAIHLAQHRNFRGVILITPLTSGKDMAVAMGLGWLKFVAGDSYNSLAKINHLNTPMLIIHGDQDEVVPYHMGQRLFQEYQGPKQMVTIRGGRHNDLQEVEPLLFWGAIEKFLNKNVPK